MDSPVAIGSCVVDSLVAASVVIFPDVVVVDANVVVVDADVVVTVVGLVVKIADVSDLVAVNGAVNDDVGGFKLCRS